MFGYIKAYKPELKVREDEYYRAAYCGLCRAMGKCCGCRSRTTLSYDMVFALLCRIAISGETPELYVGHCALHPLKKRPFMKISPELAFTARASVLLAYAKLSDDVNDERGAKKLAARVGRAFLKKGNKKAKRELAELSEQINSGLTELSLLEARCEPTVDRPADLFGGIMANVLSHGYDGADKKISRKIGSHAGRWVYIVDALDDCEDDEKRKRYNPFLMLYGACPTEEQKKAVIDVLTAELNEIRNALDLVDEGERRDVFAILENMICYGMRNSAMAVIGKDKNK